MKKRAIIMPFGDGTGPWWAGGNWMCRRGWRRGPGFGRGYGRGFGRGPSFWATPPAQPTKEEEAAILKEEAAYLEERLKEIKKRIQELK